MGQLERYGLYVLCIVISLILGIAIWGGDPAVPETGLRDGASLDGRQAEEPFRTAPKILTAEPPARDPDSLPPFLRPIEEPAGGGAHAPQPAVEPGPVPAVALRTHKVVENDTLEKLAEQYLGKKTRWPEIKELNPTVNEKNLRLGTELRIPARTAVEAGARASQAPLAADEYLVVDGDSPARISKKLFGTELHAQQIMDLNRITDPTRIKAGAVLKVPQPDPDRSRK